MSTITRGSTQMTGLFNQEFVSKGLSYTVSSMSANVAVDLSVTCFTEEVVERMIETMPRFKAGQRTECVQGRWWRAVAELYQICQDVVTPELRRATIEWMTRRKAAPTMMKDCSECHLRKPGKGDGSDAKEHYRMIALLNHWGKAVMKQAMDREDPTLTRDAILIVDEKAQRVAAFSARQPTARRGPLMVFQVLFDLSKAFDLIDREKAWRAMEKRGVSAACLSLLRGMHAGTASRLHDDCGRTVRKVATSLGVRQGSVEGPTVFTVMYDETLQAIQADRNDEWLAVFCDPALCTSRIEASIKRQTTLSETVFMDDLSQMRVARDEAAVEEMIQRTSERLAADGLTVNSGKLEVTAKAFGPGFRKKNAMIQRGKVTVQAGTKKLKVKKVAKYLGSQMSIDGSVKREIEARTTAGRQAHHRLTQRLWRSNALSERIKVRLWRALVQSILLCALEARVLDGGAAERLEKTLIRCLRHLTRQPAHITNVSSEEIRVRCGVPTVAQASLGVATENRSAHLLEQHGQTPAWRITIRSHPGSQVGHLRKMRVRVE